MALNLDLQPQESIIYSGKKFLLYNNVVIKIKQKHVSKLGYWGMLPKTFVACRENIQLTNFFFFHFLYHIKHIQSVTLQSPDSFIQWLVNSTNFRKRLFGQIGNLAGHDRWPIIILTTDLHIVILWNFSNYWYILDI